MNMNNRVKEVRKTLGLTQVEFGRKIAVAQGYMTSLESGYRELTEKLIKLICLEFSVNEDWLRYGKEEMFIQSELFSLDSYAKKNNITSLEFDIIKGYIELDRDTRNSLIAHFKTIFERHYDKENIKE